MKWNKKRVHERLKELDKKLQRRPIKKDDSNLYFLSRKYFGTWNKMMNEAGYNVKFRQKAKLPVFSNKLFYFLGLLCTDGHLQFVQKGGKYRLILFTSYKEEREMILKLIKSLFNYQASVRSKKYGFAKKLNYEIYISSKELCEFCNRLGIPYGKKSDIIEIPEIIIKENVNNISHFIRGVFDGDGSIIKTGKQNVFKIDMGSENFIRGLNVLLFKMGINSVKIRQERETLWDLRINKQSDIKKLYFLLYKNSQDYFYSRKREKWKQYI